MSTSGAHQLFATRPSSRALLDVAVALVALVGSLAQLSHGGIFPARSGAGHVDLVGVVLVVCSTAPLVGWRRSPLAVYVATSAASALLAGLGYSLDLPLGVVVALFLLAASRDREAPWTLRTTVVVVAMLLAYLGAAAMAQAAFPGIELLHTGLAAVGSWFAGEWTRLRREQLAELQERAVVEERARIARDLHDSAGHAISVIAVRAGAARLRHAEEPERSLPALAAIEELARQTVDELDQIVGTLREGGSVDGALRAPPGIASLDTLVSHHATAGLTVTLHSTGTPRPLAGVVDQGAYRIVQEALSNAARHGTGSARIVLTYRAEALDVTVTNPVRAATASRPGGGHGLIGMRERASMLGGSLDAERADGAFVVRARIPYGGQPA
ncbi:MAG: histidine kinase [Streptosporangiales bacterium]|nr:histidine kinase [Streptosporangiales bacterium]